MLYTFFPEDFIWGLENSKIMKKCEWNSPKMYPALQKFLKMASNKFRKGPGFFQFKIINPDFVRYSFSLKSYAVRISLPLFIMSIFLDFYSYLLPWKNFCYNLLPPHILFQLSSNLCIFTIRYFLQTTKNFGPCF